MKLEPRYKSGDSTLKTYKYGPFFVLMVKNSITLEWIIKIKMSERSRKYVHTSDRFRATDNNVKKYMNELIHRKKYEIVELIFKG